MALGRVPLGDRRNHTLVIDMGAISFEIAVGWIAEATQALERKEFGADAVTAQQVKGDPSLSDAIDISRKCCNFSGLP
jgi:hypothetical protein